jgi:hypothetical protein
MTTHLPRLALGAAVLVAVLATAAIGLGAVGDDSTPTALRAATPTEAHAALDDLVAVVTRDGPEAVCGELAASIPTCLRLARSIPAGPAGAPTVVDEREVASHAVDGGLVQGGRLLVLCGTRTDDTRYRTEILMWVDDGAVVVLHPVWWSGTTIVTDGVQSLGSGRLGAVATTAAPTQPDASCPA